MKKNLDLIYSEHELSLALSFSSFTGMPLKQRKQASLQELQTELHGGFGMLKKEKF